MIYGVDLDNTIICYDGLFFAAAVEHGLMPESGPRDKKGVRGWFIGRGREDGFTFLQGHVYGAGLKNAKPYSGVLSCLRRWRDAGVEVFIVSHKTVWPHAGPRRNLREAAMEWLAANGFFAAGLLTPEDVYFEETMEEKARRVASLGCEHFFDDMKRFLTHPLFPAETVPWLFQPQGDGGQSGQGDRLRVFTSWDSVQDVLEPGR